MIIKNAFVGITNYNKAEVDVDVYSKVGTSIEYIVYIMISYTLILY